MILIARMKQIIEGLLSYVQYDFETVPENETFLYHMFFGTKDGQFDFYEQAKKIFLRGKTSPRMLKVSMEYPKDKSHMPCVIVRDPQRTEEREPLGGFALSPESNFGSEEYQREGYSMFVASKVHLMCLSDNMLESVLIGEVIYSLILGARNTFEAEFTNFKLGMSELLAENNLFPLPILIKNIEIDLDWDQRYASIIRPEIVRSFVIEDAVPIKE